MAALGLAASLLVACASAPTAPGPAPSTPASAGAPTESVETTETVAGAQGSAVPAAIAVPERAASEFARAVELMRAGNAGDAELEFQQLAAGYPQLAGPHVNLGILYRKAGKLDPAVDSLRAAVERNPASAIAWNELGVTLRMRGNFQDAAAAYERAIAIDPAYAPAHRNLGVLRDLYLGDANAALDSFERYKSLTGEDKQLNGWLAELRQRTGRPASAAPPASAPAPESTSAPESTPAQPATEEPAAGQPPPGEGAIE